jgi:hypothetical protein
MGPAYNTRLWCLTDCPLTGAHVQVVLGTTFTISTLQALWLPTIKLGMVAAAGLDDHSIELCEWWHILILAVCVRGKCMSSVLERLAVMYSNSYRPRGSAPQDAHVFLVTQTRSHT